jgi:hypothetical protein
MQMPAFGLKRVLSAAEAGRDFRTFHSQSLPDSRAFPVRSYVPIDGGVKEIYLDWLFDAVIGSRRQNARAAA